MSLAPSFQQGQGIQPNILPRQRSSENSREHLRVISGGRRYFAQITEQHDRILSAVPKTANRLYQLFRRSGPPGKVHLISYRELAAELGLRDIKTIRNNLGHLADTGLLQRQKLGVRSGYEKVIVLDPWQIAAPSEPSAPPVDEPSGKGKKSLKGDLNPVIQPSNPHSAVPSFKDKEENNTGGEFESVTEPTHHPVGRSEIDRGETGSDLQAIGGVSRYLQETELRQPETDSVDGSAQTAPEPATEACGARQEAALLETGKPRPVTRQDRQKQTNSGEDNDSAAAAFFAELERFLGIRLKAPHRKYISDLGQGKWREVRLVAEQLIQARGRNAVKDDDRWLTSALKGLREGTWNLVPMSRLRYDDRLSGEQRQWLEVAEARGLVVKGYRAEQHCYFCEVRPGLHGSGTPKALAACMTWWPLPYLQQQQGQITGAEALGILNSARIARGLPPL